MKMLCPQCGSALPPEAINISTDLAQCPECGRVSRAAACVVEDEISKKRIIFTNFDIHTRFYASTTLPDKNISGNHILTAVTFDTKAL